MIMVDKILVALDEPGNGGVLKVGKDGEKYYRLDRIVEALKENFNEEPGKVKLPGFISDAIFKAEDKGLNLVEFIVDLRLGEDFSKEGAWFKDEVNQEKLILGWLLGYVVEDEKLPEEVEDEIKELESEGKSFFEYLRYHSASDGEALKWILSDNYQEVRNERLEKVFDFWKTLR